MINFKKFLAISWTLILFGGLMLPNKQLPEVHLNYLDKLIHFASFALLTYLWLINSYSRPKILIATFLFALITEISQKFLTADRSFEWLDLLFDFLGVVLVLTTNNYLHKTKVFKIKNT